MRATLLSWAIRTAVVAAATAGFNYWLHSQADPTDAGGSQRYARLEHYGYFGQYLGIQGDVLVGNPIPCYEGSCAFSNQTLWPGRVSGCSGPSWVETGWYKGVHSVTGQFGWYYKFIYRVPGTNGCTYTEAMMYWLGFHVASVTTGWTYAHVVQAGGEVSSTGIGMAGGVNNVKYGRQFSPGLGYTPITSDDPYVSYLCDYGYALFWVGYDDIQTVGYYNGQGNCPQG